MFTEVNENIVHLLQEIYKSSHLDRMTEVVSEDLQTTNIMPGTPRGSEEAKTAHQNMLAGFPDHQTILEEMIVIA